MTRRGEESVQIARKRAERQRIIVEVTRVAPAAYWAGIFEAGGEVYCRVSADGTTYSWVTLKVQKRELRQMFRQVWRAHSAGKSVVKITGNYGTAFAEMIEPFLTSPDQKEYVALFRELREMMELPDRDERALLQIEQRAAIAQKLAYFRRKDVTWREALAEAQRTEIVDPDCLTLRARGE